MNGWIEGHPAWWLNLQAQPEAVVRLDGEEPRPVRARAGAGGARPAVERLDRVNPKLDAYAATRRP